MAKEILSIHPETPELRKVNMVVDALKNGAVILYPTDTGYALGCTLSNKESITRIRQMRNIPESKAMSFLCYSLSNVAEFAKVSNQAYKTLKRLIPGPYTFVLPASKNVPKFAQDPKRNTAGIRVPESDLARLILKTLEAPLISITAKRDDIDYADHDLIFDYFSPQVDMAIRHDGFKFSGESTVIDMTTDDFKIMREGAGYDKALEYIYEEE